MRARRHVDRQEDLLVAGVAETIDVSRSRLVLCGGGSLIDPEGSAGNPGQRV
jgi:hypothetical protein